MLKIVNRIHMATEDNGHSMSVDDFDVATTQPGYLYELGGGIIQTSEIPKPGHAKEVQAAQMSLLCFKKSIPGRLNWLPAQRGEIVCRFRAVGARRTSPSTHRRSPKRTIPGHFRFQQSSSKSSRRDRQNGFWGEARRISCVGIRGYWIGDSSEGRMTVFSRWRGHWKKQIVKPPAKFKTSVLPGFSLRP